MELRALSTEELGMVGGGLNPQPLPPGKIAQWAIGTSSSFQALMVARLEVLGNPIVNGGAFVG